MLDPDLSLGWYDDGSGPRRWWDDRHWPVATDLDTEPAGPRTEDELLLASAGSPEGRWVAILLAILGIIMIGLVIVLAERTDHDQRGSNHHDGAPRVDRITSSLRVIAQP
jgi:hypothetical protein